MERDKVASRLSSYFPRNSFPTIVCAFVFSSFFHALRLQVAVVGKLIKEDGVGRSIKGGKA